MYMYCIEGSIPSELQESQVNAFCVSDDTCRISGLLVADFHRLVIRIHTTGRYNNQWYMNYKWLTEKIPLFLTT